MNRRLIIWSIAFLILIGFIIYIDSQRQKPVNWFPSFSKNHKTPYGTYVMRKELEYLFPNSKINDVNIPPYNFFQNENNKGTYIFINNIIQFDEAEIEKLINYLHSGNDVFISSEHIEIDSLHVSTERFFSTLMENTLFFELENKQLNKNTYLFEKEFENNTFSELDTLNTIVLGQTGFLNANNEVDIEGINFVKISVGKGHLFLHTFPQAFSNYYLLKNQNYKYSAAVLSYLDARKPIFWDEYYKTGKSNISSPLHYILVNKNLKWAYYFVLIGILTFVLFEGKRKQRVIPIITPLINQSLAFTQTIANMYFEKSDNKAIANLRIENLMDYIRSHLRIPTDTINKSFYHYVASRSDKDEEKVASLFKYIAFIQDKDEISKEQLIKLNSQIEWLINS